jgi:hypothetical protein
MNKDPLAGIDTTGMTSEQIEAAKKQGEKQNGLAIMSGIQGAFAGLQGLFGGEAGSDMSQLLGGLGGLGVA